MKRLHSEFASGFTSNHLFVLTTVLLFLFCTTALADRQYVVSLVDSEGQLTSSLVDQGGSVTVGSTWDQEECDHINGHAFSLPVVPENTRTVYLGVLVNDIFCYVKSVPLTAYYDDGDRYDAVRKSDVSFTFAGRTYTSSSDWLVGNAPDKINLPAEEGYKTSYLDVVTDASGRCYMIPAGSAGKFYTVQRIAYNSSGSISAWDSQLVRYGENASADSNWDSASCSNITQRQIIYGGYYNSGNKTITWLDSDGTVLHTQKLGNAAAISSGGGWIPTYGGPALTVKKDADYVHTFSGWSPEPSAVTGNASYTAMYTTAPRQYTLTVQRQHRGRAIAENETYILDNGSSVEVQLDTYIRNYTPVASGTETVTVQGSDMTFTVNYANRQIPLKIYLMLDGEYTLSEDPYPYYVTWMGSEYGIYYETEGLLRVLPYWQLGDYRESFSRSEAGSWLLGTSLEDLDYMMQPVITGKDGTYTDQWYVVVNGVDDLAEAYYAVPPNAEFYTVTFNYPSDLNDPASEIISTSVITRKGANAAPPVSADGWGWDSSAYLNVQETCTVNMVQGTTVPIPAANTGLVYNGEEQTGVNAGEHYTLSNERAVNAGTYYAQAVPGDGCFWQDGSPAPKSIRYTIAKAPVTVSGITSETVYSGQSQSASGISWEGLVDEESSISGVEWSAEGTDTGSYSGAFTGSAVIMDGQGNDQTENYEITLVKGRLTIAKRDIADAVITLADNEYYAHNTYWRPEVTSVVVDGNTLNAGTDYTVSYNNNINVGTASVTLTGKGNYSGTAQTEFAILEPVNIAEAEITLGQYEYDWTGEAHTPAVTVRYGEEELTEGTDYTVTYANNQNAGTAKVTVSGAERFTGTSEVNFSILPKDMSGAEVTLTQTEFDFTSMEIMPSVGSVLLDGVELKSYRVSYENNINVGSGRVIVSGYGNYTGSASAEFTIRSVHRAPEPDTGYVVDWAPYSKPYFSGGVCHIYLDQDISLSADYNNERSFSNYGTLYIDLNGHTIHTALLSSVERGMRLVLSDSAGGGSVQPLSGVTYACGVRITNGGMFDMYGGRISAFTAVNSYGDGGAVYIQEGGTFNMYGGELKDNKKGSISSGGAIYNSRGTVCIRDGEISGNTGLYGGGIYSYMGSLYISGGVISGNSSSYQGGGIYFTKNYTSSAGDFEMTGGSVTENHAGSYGGGGIYASDCTFEMSGGSISGNYVAGNGNIYGGGLEALSSIVHLSGTAEIADNYIEPFDENTSASGGGIFTSGTMDITQGVRITGNHIGRSDQYCYTAPVGAGISNSGVLTMNGGTISGNTGFGANGGGVFNSGTLNLSGGEISGNQANSTAGYGGGCGGGIYNTGTLKLDGGSITGNMSAIESSAIYNTGTAEISGGITITGNPSTEGNPAIGPEIPVVSAPLTGSIVTGLAADGALKTAESDGTYVLTAQDAQVFASEDGRPGFLRGWDSCIYVGTEPEYVLTLTGAQKTDAGLPDTFPAGTQVEVSADLSEGQILLDWQNSDTDRPIEGNESTVTVLIPDHDIEVTARILDDPSIAPQTYTGEALTPEFDVVLNGTLLSRDTDYTLTWSDNVNAGTASVAITSTAEPMWTAEASFVIDPMEITVTGASVEAEYDGTVKNADGITIEGMPEGMSLTGLAWTAEGVDAATYEGAFEGTGIVTDASGADISANCSIVCVNGSLIIHPKSLEGAEIWPLEEEMSYTGAALVPEILVLLGDEELAAGTDYTIRCENNIAAGTGDIIVEGTGNYTGEAAGTFTIVKSSLSGAVLTVAEGPHIYSTQELRPSVEVVFGDSILTEGVDYTLTWSDNTAAGTATVKATGIGSCTGSKSGSFVIDKLNISGAAIASHAVRVSGWPVEPAFEVTVDGILLTQGVDYEAGYTDNDSLGTATMTITGIGSCEGETSAEFVIEKALMEDAVISLPESIIYTGEEIIPDAEVVIDGWTLEENVDYTLAAENNVDAGTGILTVTGLGSCEGIVTLEFTISPKSISGAEITAPDAVYTGSTVIPDAVVTLDGAVLTDGVDYTLSFEDNTEPGTGKITAAGMGNYTGTAEGTFTIISSSLENAQIVLSGGNLVYSGKEITPNALVRLNGKRLTANTDYVLSYEDNVNAGTAQVIVTGIGNYTGTARKTFTIRPLDLSGTDVVTEGTAVYTGETMAVKAEVTLDGTVLTENTDYTVSYEGSTEEGDARVMISGMGNYTGTAEGTLGVLDVTAMTTLKLPASLTGIREEAFAGTPVRHIALPEGCREIGTRAFADCTALTVIEIPSSVESIADDAFEGTESVWILTPEGSMAQTWAEEHGMAWIAE